MKKTLTLLLTLLLFTCTAKAIYFKQIGTAEKLSQLSVISIYQDKLGRMWFGTEEGINIFDGVSVTAYGVKDFKTKGDFIIGNKINSIVGDNKGNVYFNADNSLYQFNIEEETVACLINGGVEALCFHEDKLWIGINNSIYTLEADKKELQFYCNLVEAASAILIDELDRCWIGTKKGLYLKEKEKPLTSILEEYEITHLFKDSKTNLWISTQANGVLKMNVHNTEYTHYRAKPENALNNKEPIKMREGANLMDYRLSSNHVRCVAEDNRGFIWIATFSGLNRYTPYEDRFIIYVQNDRPGSLTHSSIFPIYKDKQGTIWLGTYYGGVNYFNTETDIFRYYYADIKNENSLSYPFVGHMVEDKDNNIWICTEGGGLNFFDRKSKKFTHYLMDGKKNSIAHNNVKCILYDALNEKLYLGTHTGGLSIFDIKRKVFYNPYVQNHLYREKIGDRVVGLELLGDTLIFITQFGIWKMNIYTEEITPYFKSFNLHAIICFMIDSKGYVWISTNEGLYRINTKNEHEKYYYKYKTHGLGHFPVNHLIEDVNGVIYLGTNGSGFYEFNEKDNTFIGYTTSNSELASNYCYRLNKFDDRAYIIITGNKGISFFNSITKEFTVVELESSMPLKKINLGCGLLICKNGEIFIGGMNGVVSFFNQDLKNSIPKYNLFFSELFINNERVIPKDSTNILQENICYTDQLNLKYNQNDIELYFRTSNYVAPLERTTYEYQLEGFEDRWISTTDNKIHYTNIPPGKYTLTVREKNTQISHVITLKIKITPPFYASPFSYTLYLLSLFGILYGILRFKQSQFLLKTSLAIEKREKERTKEVSQAKLQFFANISHEFRTPLTLITSQVEVLLKNKSLSPIVVSKLKKIFHNTQQLRNLINELLDFRKLEQGYTKLRVSEWDIVPFLTDIYLIFKEYAATNCINYDFRVEGESIMCWFDPRQLEKVVNNLLSNAFKYTKAEGNIILSVLQNDENVIIKVIDSGIGISKEDIDKIFERFYQVDSKAARVSDSFSTGIGLALAKSIVELHHGSINVESKEGYGTIFRVILLKGDSHFSEEERIDSSENLFQLSKPILLDKDEEDETIVNECKEEISDTKKKILIIEDNNELLAVLEELFVQTYKVIKASNGVEGIEKAQKEMPNIIVSDVMMPEMSGFELCMRIKNDFNICHIPVILLTALGTTQNSIEGLKVGADDYITKPFDSQVLLARCESLIYNRHLLQRKYQKDDTLNVEELSVNPIDQKFLSTVHEVIEKNLSNSEFDVNNLASELALSRSSFYTKFKALTGTTPNEYIQIYKLKRAAYWLRNNPEMQISDITYELGFTSPRYFTRCFKVQFSITPTDYRKKEKQG